MDGQSMAGLEGNFCVVIMKCRTVLSGNGNWADVAALYMKVNGWC